MALMMVVMMLASHCQKLAFGKMYKTHKEKLLAVIKFFQELEAASQS